LINGNLKVEVDDDDEKPQRKVNHKKKKSFAGGKP